jgi:hypothetical protein
MMGTPTTPSRFDPAAIRKEADYCDKLSEKAEDISHRAASAALSADDAAFYDRFHPSYVRVVEKFERRAAEGRDRIRGIGQRLREIATAYETREETNQQNFHKLMPTNPQNP